jgi:hypothetical protein
MYIVLIVNIWNVLDVNRLGDYICVCLTRVASTELETVGNDSCSMPEEEEEGYSRNASSVPNWISTFLFQAIQLLTYCYLNTFFITMLSLSVNWTFPL